jgi:enoyl-CoA hydratase
MSKPVIGAINGLAAEGGVEFLKVCGIVIVEQRFLRLQLHGHRELPRLGKPQLRPTRVGLRRADEILLLSRRVSAPRRLRIPHTSHWLALWLRQPRPRL